MLRAMTNAGGEPIDGTAGPLDAFDANTTTPIHAAACTELEQGPNTTASFGLWPFVELLRRDHMPMERLCELTGIQVLQLRDPGVRFSQTAINRVIELAYQRLGTSAAMAAALTVEAGHFHLLELIARTAPRVVDGLIQGCRFFPLLHNGGQLLHEPADAGAQRVRWLPPSGYEVHRGCIELTFAVMILGMRRETGRPSITPSEVCFSHAAPTDMTLHQRILGQNISFGTKETYLLFDKRVASLPLTRKNSEVHAAAIRSAADAIED
jgi:hypothetical protein